RLAALERLRTLLVAAAGEVAILRETNPDITEGYMRLRACEAQALPLTPLAPLPAKPAFPPLDVGIDRVDAHAPGWSGLDGAALAEARRSALGLGPGTVEVVDVALGSPAEIAGFKVGDLVLGPPDAPFADATELASAVALAPPGTTRELEVLRGS